MEDAVGSKTSVYVGCMGAEYSALTQRDPELQAQYLATGVGSAMLSNRISWFYDLQGPSITLDTACSSSLNALHLACQGLRSRETNMVSGIVASVTTNHCIGRMTNDVLFFFSGTRMRL